MTVLLHQYLGGKGCVIQVVKAQQRVQQEGGENLAFYFVFLEQVTIKLSAGVESWKECVCGDWLRAGEQHHAGGRGGRRHH